MSSTTSAGPAPVPQFSRKDASHAAFYSGVGKGILAAFEGIQLFFTSKRLRMEFWELMKPIRNAQIMYFSIGVLIFLLVRDPADDMSELFWTISRWSRVITVITTLLLENRHKADHAMFFAALKEKNLAFGEALEKKQIEKASIRVKLSKVTRVAKITLFKVAGTMLQRLFPAGRHITVPIVKFISMRPVLGDGVAAAVAGIHAIPLDILESSRMDDALVSFGEAVIDADDLGSEMTKEYRRRLDTEQVKHYFEQRFRGYTTGCGFVYSLLCAIPFVGIPMTLIGECGAACLVADIVERNLLKENSMSLVGEECFANKKDE